MSDIKYRQWLKGLLYAGFGYFFCVAVVHVVGLKIPGLFVYFNVPSYSYQDRIISFLALGWSAFFFLAARKMDRDLIKLILIIGLLAIVALVYNTLATDFSRFEGAIQIMPFLVITALLAVYLASLAFLTWKQTTEKKQ